jgi:hypothetical protein
MKFRINGLQFIHEYFVLGILELAVQIHYQNKQQKESCLNKSKPCATCTSVFSKYNNVSMQAHSKHPVIAADIEHKKGKFLSRH